MEEGNRIHTVCSSNPNTAVTYVVCAFRELFEQTSYVGRVICNFAYFVVLVIIC